MDVEVNLLQQRFNKIESEKKLKKRSFTLKNKKKCKNMKLINITNLLKLIKKFKALLIGESVLIKHLTNSIHDYPYMHFTRKWKYNEDIVLSSIWDEFDCNTLYFCQIFIFQKLIIFPLSLKFHPQKREFSFPRIEKAKGILICQKRILFFKDGILEKGENSHFLTK